MRKTIAAVGYARRSTDMQERSIPDQKAYVEKWAKEHGYRIARWYVDDAISGTSTKGRADFERMIDAAENGRDFEAVLVYDLSRFSRGGTNETGYYLHRLHMASVEAIFCAEGIPDGEEGELLQGVKSWQARQYSVKLARDSIRGQISNIRERKSAPGGVAPYGYDKQYMTSDGQVLRTLRWLPDGSKQEFGQDGKLLRTLAPGVNIKKAKSDIVRYVPSTPERVEVMKRMFDLCAQGYGYGTWPEQKRAYFTLRDLRATIGRAAPGAGMEGQIYAALEKLTAEKLGRAYRREDGAEMHIDRCLIDANWGQSTDVVYQFCRQSQFAGILLPAHGKYVGASSIPFSEYKRKRGDRVGLHWRIPNTTGKRQVRHVLVDTNYWKTFVHARLAVAMGDPGCLSLPGRDDKAHRLLADHLTAEYRVKASAQGRTVDEWKLRATRPDNHWLDCLVGCAVGASMQGAALPSTGEASTTQRRRIRLSEMQRNRG